MSHITKLQTKFSDLEALSEACQELGLQLEQGEGLTVLDYYGNSVPVEARIPFGRYSLGFQRQADGTLTMAADFWGIALHATAPKVRAACQGISGSVDQISAQTQERLAKLLQRPYEVAVTRREIARNPKYRGYRVQEERNPDGEVVRITLARRTY